MIFEPLQNIMIHLNITSLLIPLNILFLSQLTYEHIENTHDEIIFEIENVRYTSLMNEKSCGKIAHLRIDLSTIAVSVLSTCFSNAKSCLPHLRKDLRPSINFD